MIKYASITNVGSRNCNEDNFKVSSVSDRHCFVVCDGLGGHNAGDVASKIATNVFVDEFCYCNDLLNFLENAFDSAQKRILLYQKENNSYRNMKTTAVCMSTDGNHVYVGHVGDSRFYGFKKDGSYIRTLDHSIPQLLVQSQTITEVEIRNHPNRNMLFKVLGEKSDEAACELSEPLSMDDFSAFLLCSDGFWELINEADMTSCLNTSSTPQEWLDKMTAIVELNGVNKNMDNYTAITVMP